METDVASRKLFIGGLSYGTDDDKLKSYFEQYGSVQDAVVMKDPVTRRSRGFGFITYTHPAYVDQALAIGIHVIDSRKVEAKRAVPRHEVARETSPSKPSNQTHTNGNYHTGNSHHFHSDTHLNSDEQQYCKIFVGGLHYDTRDGEFRHYFEQYGKVISAEVMFNRETHKSRGFGFIIFDNEASVDQVCDEREHTIDGKTVEVKRAVPRSKIGNPTTSEPASVTSLANAPIPAHAPSSAQKNMKQSSSVPGPQPGQAEFPTLPTKIQGQGNQAPVSSPVSQKATPGSPPSSYAAAVICGPNGLPTKSPSQQSSPQVQASPKLGPIGSPTHSASSSISNLNFGMMLPPLHSSVNANSGPNSLNNSAHGSYQAPQSQSLFQTEKKFTAPPSPAAAPTPHLLQHQEQFPLPTSPLRSVTASYPHSHFDNQHHAAAAPPSHNNQLYPSPPYPGPHPYPHSRSRAYTESFLFMSSQKASLSFPFQQMTFSPSPDLPYPPLLPSNLDSNPDEPLEQSSQQSPGGGDEDLSWSPSRKPSSVSGGNRESQLEDIFVSSRQDMERSVSLGGLGWMPSSLAGQTHPPESRRGFSDLGIGIGFGSGGTLGRDSTFGFEYQSPNSQQAQAFVPSMSAWESFVDLSAGGAGGGGDINSPSLSQHSPQHSSPLRPHSYSLNHLHEGLSPNSRLHHHREGDDDDGHYQIQELRLQAPEYNPNNQSHSSQQWGAR